MSEVRRVLRRGGIIFVSDLWLQTDARNVERYERDRWRFGCYGCFELPEGVVVRHHDRDWVEQLFAGFERIALTDVNVVTMNGNPAAAFQYIGRKP